MVCVVISVRSRGSSGALWLPLFDEMSIKSIQIHFSLLYNKLGNLPQLDLTLVTMYVIMDMLDLHVMCNSSGTWGAEWTWERDYWCVHSIIFLRHTGIVAFGAEYFYGGMGIEYCPPVS